ncbi:unnamed protein product [Calicophoron daubneyi]|uniref:Uncharacterized protein n=1 Tax=Calicophoron daubneyi TaxID=300641 RepID=A0AAV2THV0_CALDB
MSAENDSFMDKLQSFWHRLRQHLPDLIPQPPPRIRDYGEVPYFHPCWLGKREDRSQANGEINNFEIPPLRSSIPRDSVGAISQNLPRIDFKWLLNKKFTCVCMWFGVICLIVGIISLQIASFFRHTRQDILSTGMGCLCASLCLLTVSVFSFIHAYLIVYAWEPEAPQTDRNLSLIDEFPVPIEDLRFDRKEVVSSTPADG